MGGGGTLPSFDGVLMSTPRRSSFRLTSVSAQPTPVSFATHPEEALLPPFELGSGSEEEEEDERVGAGAAGMQRRAHSSVPKRRLMFLPESSSPDSPERRNAALERCNSTSTHVMHKFDRVTEAALLVEKALLTNCSLRAVKPSRVGVSGTYLLSDESSDTIIGVFKPSDEEAGAPNNERAGIDIDSDIVLGNGARASSLGFLPGEGAVREAAAYLLDVGGAKVPQTALAQYDVENEHGVLITKGGAFQVFVINEGDADDFGPGVFDVDEVHRIALLDIRVLNNDRHGGNILVTKDAEHPCQRRLVPIDHGYILPDKVTTCSWPVWMDWPQVKKPLSDELRRHVLSLDPKVDIDRVLSGLGDSIRKESLRCLKITSILLKCAVEKNLTLYDVGLMVFGQENERSILERIVEKANALVDTHRQHALPPCSGFAEALELECVEAVILDYLAQRLPRGEPAPNCPAFKLVTESPVTLPDLELQFEID